MASGCIVRKTTALLLLRVAAAVPIVEAANCSARLQLTRSSRVAGQGHLCWHATRRTEMLQPSGGSGAHYPVMF
jgi:hypothetical protein